MTRHDLGRDAFVERVWEWKQQSGSTITRQMRRLGASATGLRRHRGAERGLFHDGREDVARRRRKCSSASTRRASSTAASGSSTGTPSSAPPCRTSRWIARRRTAGSGTSATRSTTAAEAIVVATTRPETMLGDVAVAVHPDGRALPAPRRQAGRAAAHRPHDPGHRRRLRRPGVRHRLREDHAGARLQRLPGVAPAQGRRTEGCAPRRLISIFTLDAR